MKLLSFFLSILAVASARALGGDGAEELASLTLLKQAAITQVRILKHELAKLTIRLSSLLMQGAVCLDGSAPGYYFRPGKESGANKWILHFEGGGWCYLGVEDCYNRSHSHLGSSSTWSSTQAFYGALSPDQQTNPAFYNWNMVFLKYCDGGSFSASK